MRMTRRAPRPAWTNGGSRTSADARRADGPNRGTETQDIPEERAITKTARREEARESGETLDQQRERDADDREKKKKKIFIPPIPKHQPNNIGTRAVA